MGKRFWNNWRNLQRPWGSSDLDSGACLTFSCCRIKFCVYWSWYKRSGKNYRVCIKFARNTTSQYGFEGDLCKYSWIEEAHEGSAGQEKEILPVVHVRPRRVWCSPLLRVPCCVFMQERGKGDYKTNGCKGRCSINSRSLLSSNSTGIDSSEPSRSTSSWQSWGRSCRQSRSTSSWQSWGRSCK